MWKSVKVVRELGDCAFLVIITIGVALISVGKTQENQCLHYYVQQPSSAMSCNPWPYMYYYSRNDLVLHCDVLGPQNGDTLSVAWYREIYGNSGLQVQRMYGHSNNIYHYYGKFWTPKSSEDISHGFKRTNFTLFVNNVSEDDVGCYWCEIVVHSRNCLFYLRRSSVYCLDSWSTYRTRESCSALPVNSSVVCAANKTCSDLPENFVADPYLVVDGNKDKDSDLSVQVPTQSSSVPENIWPQLSTSLEIRTTSVIKSNTITSLRFPCTIQHPLSTYSGSPISDPTLWNDEHVHKSKTILSTVLTSRIPEYRLHLAPIVMSSDPNLIISPSTTAAFTEGTDDGTSTLSSPTIRPLGSNKLANGTSAQEVALSPVHIGIFMGIGVCAVLFAVISMLIFGVVMLCRKTEPRASGRNINHKGMRGQRNMQAHGNREAFSGIWRREASPAVTSVVNTGHVIPPRSVPTYSNIPATINNEDNNGRPYISYPLPIVLDTGGRWRTHSLPLLSERSNSINRGNQLRQSQYYVSLEGEIRHKHETGSRTSFRLPRSPDLHYYHVLERPEYYNCLWTGGEGSGEITLAEASTSNQKSVTIPGDDSDSDSLYHWKVVLTSSTRQEEPGQDLDRSSSSKRVGRHLYRRLDHSTMVPHQNYAKVSVGHHDFEGNESHV